MRYNLASSKSTSNTGANCSTSRTSKNCKCQNSDPSIANPYRQFTCSRGPMAGASKSVFPCNEKIRWHKRLGSWWVIPNKWQYRRFLDFDYPNRENSTIDGGKGEDEQDDEDCLDKIISASIFFQLIFCICKSYIFLNFTDNWKIDEKAIFVGAVRLSQVLSSLLKQFYDNLFAADILVICNILENSMQGTTANTSRLEPTDEATEVDLRQHA